MKASLLDNFFIFEVMRKRIQLCLQNTESACLNKAVGFNRPALLIPFVRK
jgi:hypothetical protein